jgi:hypothetical protein
MTALVQVSVPPVLVIPVTVVFAPVLEELPVTKATSSSLAACVVSVGVVMIVPVAEESLDTVASIANPWAKMLRLKFFVAVACALSATLTVKLLVPAVVGVPDMVPVARLRERPAGSPPEVIDHV